ncbi:LPXTG-motif cell wall anchor domain-containing protein [Streptococcus equinus]|uniref:LPXTG-motif cell wall anchor domain-containing protein n=1 Tax=Streptococcus equinus TaxID=1335 RepID=A0A1H0ZVF9_STREI|nr:SpaA isopeptide-forming pilin-related protein [Streptococcus equinus]SDQ31360.1 LPXTG-motif cell wall anchor domain-containing protein [Streptococcus equinus]
MKKLWLNLMTRFKLRLRESVIARIALALSIIVVFCTTYALILPALTVSTDNRSALMQSAENVSTEQLESSEEKMQVEASSSEQETSEQKDSQTSLDTSLEARRLQETADNLTVVADFTQGTFTEEVSLKVRPIADTGEINQKISTVLRETKQSLSKALSYDISFINAAGQEVEPQKEVTVSLQFNAAITSSKLQSSWKLYHFIGNDINHVEDLTHESDTNIEQDSSENVKSIGFKSDSFSTYTLAGVTYAEFKEYLTGYSYDEKTVEENLATKVVTVDLELDYTISKAHLMADRYYYLELPNGTAIGQDINLGTEYIGKDTNQVDAYTYRFVYDEVTGKYYILIAFIESYVNDITDGTQSKGWIKYDATYGSDYQQNDGGYQVVYSDDLIVTIPEDSIKKNYDLTTSKSGTVTYDADTPYLTYTVKVDSKYGTPSSIAIKDILKASGISLAAIDSVSVTKSSYAGSSENVIATETLTSSAYTYQFKAASNSLDMTLPQLHSGGVDASGNPIGHFYTITYRYKISGLTAGSSVTANNTVSASSQTDTSDKQSHTSSSQVTLALNQLDKKGQYNDSDGTITWTIRVNEGQSDIAGARLTDEMFAATSDLTISPDAGATIEYKNGKISGIRFSALTNGKNTNSYTITYTTPVDFTDVGWDDSTIKNKVVLDDDGKSSTKNDQTSKEAEVTLPGTGDITKEVSEVMELSEPGVREVVWDVEIKMPNSGVLKKGTVFTDTLKDPWSPNADVHWYTKAQLEDLYHRLEEVLGKNNFTLEARQSYSDYTDYSHLRDNVHYTEFKVTLTADKTSSKDVMIHYRSMISLEKSSNQRYSNHIISGTHSVSTEYNYSKDSNVVKTDGHGNSGTTKTTSADGTVTWMVKVELDDSATSMVVTDTLPEGISLIGLSYGQRWGQINANFENNSLTQGTNGWGTYNIALNGTVSSDGVVTLDFTTTDGKSLKNNVGGNSDFWMTFTTHYDDFTEGSSKLVKSLTNNVSVTVNGEDYGSDNQTQEVTFSSDEGNSTTPDVKPIAKSGEWDNAKRQLSYSLSINPQADDLVEGSDTITLTDVMHNWSNVVSEYLIQDSVKLYYTDGTEVPTSEWAWKISSTDDGWGNHYHTLVVTMKDSKAYILDYSYQLTKPNEDAAAYYYPHNTAMLEGVANGSDHTTTTVHWQRTGTSSGFDTEKAYIISKVDADNFGLDLEGAVFTVYKYDGDSDDSNDEIVTTYQTNAKGLISIVYSSGNYQEDQIYYAKETQAPAGYELPDNPSKHYFYWDEDGSFSALPITISKLTNLSENNGSDFVENKKAKTINLTVKKQWFDADGQEIGSADGSIVYDVIQVATKENGERTETFYKSGETMSHSDDWTKNYSNLPITDAQKTVTYTYYVREHATSGFDISYDNGAQVSEEPSTLALASDSALIVMKNTAQKRYALPKTGGKGGIWYYVLGAICILIVVGVLIAFIYGKGGVA